MAYNFLINFSILATKLTTETQNIPIIILTAHALSTDVEKAKQAGADEFETKPVNVVNLVAKMEKLIQKL